MNSENKEFHDDLRASIFGLRLPCLRPSVTDSTASTNSLNNISLEQQFQGIMRKCYKKDDERENEQSQVAAATAADINYCFCRPLTRHKIGLACNHLKPAGKRTGTPTDRIRANGFFGLAPS